MWRKQLVGVDSPHPGDDHANDKFVTRLFIRFYTVPPAPNHIAPSLQGYCRKPVARWGAPSLRIPHGTGTEQAMWYDPTDRKNEARKIVFT